jgi:hypothetical protein
MAEAAVDEMPVVAEVVHGHELDGWAPQASQVPDHGQGGRGGAGPLAAGTGPSPDYTIAKELLGSPLQGRPYR